MHVIRRDLGLELADRVERIGERRLGRPLGFRPKLSVIGTPSTENLVKRAFPAVMERDGTAAAGGVVETGERIAAGEVADVAVRARDVGDVPGGQHGRRPRETEPARAMDWAVTTMSGPDAATSIGRSIGLADIGEDVGDFGVACGARNRNGVGIADAQAAQVERAAFIGGAGRARA